MVINTRPGYRAFKIRHQVSLDKELSAQRKAEADGRADYARRRLEEVDILGSPIECLIFLNQLDRLNVSRENPYWIAADKACLRYIERAEDAGRNVQAYKDAYFQLFRLNEDSRATPPDFSGEYQVGKKWGSMSDEKYAHLSAKKEFKNWRHKKHAHARKSKKA